MTKRARIDAPAGEHPDIVAFQMIDFSINFFGHKETFVLDTKILADGTQQVIDGNGFIPSGYVVQAEIS